MVQDKLSNKFLDRFIDFFLVEQQIRTNVYLISFGITFAYFLLATFIFHISERSVAIQASILLSTLVAVFVMRYVVVGHLWKNAEHHENKQFGRGWKMVFAGATAALVLTAVAAKMNVTKLQAAMVNLKLDFLTAQLDVVSAANIPDSKLRDRFEAIQSIVNSIPPGVTVKPANLYRTQTAILGALKARPVSEQTKEAGWSAAVDLDLFAAKRLAGPRIESAPTQYALNSNLIIKDQNVTLLGGPATLLLGASIIVQQSTVIFKKLDFVGDGASEAIVVMGDNSHVIVEDAIVKNIPQRIDRIVWHEVRFENVSLDYGGGPIRMQNVTLKNCNVLGLLGHHAPLELVKKIEAADKAGDSITYAYDP
jgi:uncharacterized membrane protein YidH (DUF202 family)